MRVGYQVGQVVSRGSVDLQQQWLNQLGARPRNTVGECLGV